MDKISGVYSRTNSYEQVTAPSSISDEFYYRFMPPDANSLYGLTPGETYTLSGSVSHTAGELKFRSQYSTNGNSWVDLSAPSDLGIPVSDGSVFKPFSHTFTVPTNATGIYISLQNYDYTAGSLFRFKNMKLEKGSVATNWCLSQSELTTTTRSYRGVTLNDRGLTATAGGTTVAMNSNDGFLISNHKEVSVENPSGQVFHVDTDGSLTMQGNITAGNITGVTLQGESLILEGSLKLTADTSGIVSNDGDVVFNKDGISVASGNTTVNINGGNPLRIQNNNNDIFKVDNDGSLTISGNLATGDSPNSTISGVNFTGKNLTLSGDLEVSGGHILLGDTAVLDSQGLSIIGAGLSISDNNGNQTTYIEPDGTFTTNKGFFSGTIKGSNIILNNNDGSVINANGGTFMVDSAGNVTAKSITITGNQNNKANNSASLNGVSIYGGSVIEGNTIIGGTITGGTIKAGSIDASSTIHGATINGATINGGTIYGGTNIIGTNLYVIKNTQGSNLDEVDDSKQSWFKINGQMIEWHRADTGSYTSIGTGLTIATFNEGETQPTETNSQGLAIADTNEIDIGIGDIAKYSGVDWDDHRIEQEQNMSWMLPTNLQFKSNLVQVNLRPANPNIGGGDTFDIQKNDCIGAYFGQGDKGNQINLVCGDVNVTGNFHATGSKTSVVQTSQGYVGITAYETAEYYFGDIGEANTGENSQVVIGIDKIFNETINTTVPYQVFITPYSNCYIWVEQRYDNRFVVRSDKPNAQFGWELKAKRKGYENYRLRHVDGIKEKGEFKV